MSGVNTINGKLAFSVPLASADGVNGIDAGVTLSYNSNILHQVTTWNQDMPTELAGLGWSLPLARIARQPLFTGNPADDVISLSLDQSDSPLYLAGEITDQDGTIVRTYRARDFAYWKITHRFRIASNGERTLDEWTAVNEEGRTMRFGGAVTRAADGNHTAIGNSIEWLVDWDGWVGESTRVWKDPQQTQRAQSQQPLVWHATLMTDIYGNSVEFAYDADLLRVGTNEGLQYTRAAYLREIRIAPGHTIRLNYADKEPDEYPEDRQISAGVTLNQDRYYTRYLDSVEVYNAVAWSNALTTRVVLDYGSDPTDPTRAKLLNRAHPTMAKRLLYGIRHYNGEGVLLNPPVLFSYYGQDGQGTDYNVSPTSAQVFHGVNGVGGLYGAMSSQTAVGGAVFRYTYRERPVEDADRRSALFGGEVSDPPNGTLRSLGVQSYFGPDYVMVVSCARFTRGDDPPVAGFRALVTFHLYDAFGGKWQERWSHSVELQPDVSEEYWSRLLRVITAKDFIVVAVDSSSIRHANETPPLILYRDPENRELWKGAFQPPPNVNLTGFYYPQKNCWSVDAGDRLAALLDPVDGIIYYYWWDGQHWQAEHANVGDPDTDQRMVAGSSWFIVASLNAQWQANIQAFYRGFDGQFGLGFTVVHQFVVPPNGNILAIDLSATTNTAVVQVWSRTPSAQHRRLQLLSLRWTDITSAPTTIQLQDVVDGAPSPIFLLRFLDDEWRHATPQSNVQCTKNNIVVRNFVNNGTTNYPVFRAFRYDGVQWQGPHVEMWTGLATSLDQSDNFILPSANDLTLRKALLDEYAVHEYDPINGLWRDATAVEKLGLPAWQSVLSIIFDFLDTATMLLFVLPLGAIANLALWAVMTAEVITRAIANIRELRLNTEVGGNPDNLCIANALGTAVHLYRRIDAPWTDWKPVANASLASQIEARHVDLTDHGMAIKHSNGNCSFVHATNGNLAVSGPFYDFTEVGYAASDLGVQGAGSRFITTFINDAVLSIDPWSIWYRLHEVSDLRVDGPYVDYVADRIDIDNGYQTVTTRYDYTPAALPGGAYLPLYRPETFASIYNRVRTLVADGAVAGHTDSYFYNGRATAPPFSPTDGNANANTSIVAGASYVTHQFTSGVAEPVAESLSVTRVFKQDVGGNNLYSMRTLQSVDVVDGIATTHDFRFDMDASGFVREYKTYADAPQGQGEVVRSEVTYAWEIPEYAQAMTARNLLAPIAQTRTFKERVPADEPTARLDYSFDLVDPTVDGRPDVAAAQIASTRDATIFGKPFNLNQVYVPYIEFRGSALVLAVTGFDDSGNATARTSVPTELLAGAGYGLNAIFPSGQWSLGPLLCLPGTRRTGQTEQSVIVVVNALSDWIFRVFTLPQPAGKPAGFFRGVGFAFPPTSIMGFASDPVTIYTIEFSGAFVPTLTAVVDVPARWPGHEVCTSPVNAFEALSAVFGVTGANGDIARGGLARLDPPGINLTWTLEIGATPIGELAVMKIGTDSEAWPVCTVAIDATGAYKLFVVGQNRSQSGGVVTYSPAILASRALTFQPLPGALVAVERNIYVLGTDSRLRKFRLSTDQTSVQDVWDDVLLPGQLRGKIAVAADGDLFLGFDGGNVSGCLAISPNGDTRWRFDTVDATAFGPVVQDDRTFVVAAKRSNDGETLFALAEHGNANIDVEYSRVTTWDTSTFMQKSAYVWRGTNSSTFVDWLDTDPPGPDWARMSRNTWTARGIVLEHVNATRMPVSTLRGRDWLQQVAGFDGASLRTSEAHFCGFEAYERDDFNASGGAAPIDSDSYTGARSLRVPAGGRARLLTTERAPAALTRAQGTVVLCAYIKTRAGFAPGAGCTIALEVVSASGTRTRLEPHIDVVDTAGAWQRVQAFVDVGATRVIGQWLGWAVEHNGNGELLIDHVWYAPRGASMTAIVHDPTYGLPIAAIDLHGNVARTSYDDRQRPVASTDTDGRVISLDMHAWSRDMSANGLFDPALPNEGTGVRARGGGQLFRFRTAQDLQGWSTNGVWSDGSIVLQASQFLQRPAPTQHFSYGVRAQMRTNFAAPGGAAPPVPPTASLTIGAGTIAFVRDTSTRFTFVPADESPPQTFFVPVASDWVLLQLAGEPYQSGGVTVRDLTCYFFADGRQLLATRVNAVAETALQASIRFAVASDPAPASAAVRDVAVFEDPLMQAGYVDGTGESRQTQLHEDFRTVALASEHLYDAAGRLTFVTVPVRKHDTSGVRASFALAFEPQFVTQRNPAQGGDLWQTDPANPNRGRITGLVTQWAGLDNPDLGADNLPYVYDGTYDERNALGRPAETTDSDKAFIVGSGHSTKYKYAGDDDSHALLTVRGRTDFDNYHVRTKLPPLSDTARLTATNIKDKLGQPIVSGTGYGTQPFDNLDYVVAGDQLAYRQDGTVVHRTLMPNYFLKPGDQSDHRPFQRMTATSPLMHTTIGAAPDSGMEQTVLDLNGRIRFKQDALAREANYFGHNTYDKFSRAIDAGLICGVTWDVTALRRAAELPLGALDRGLVAHWELDQGSGDTVTDTSGNRMDGVVQNVPQWIWDAPNGLAYALQCSSPAKVFVTIPDPSALDALQGRIAFAAWVKPFSRGNDAPADYQSIVTAIAANGDALSLGLRRNRFELSHVDASGTKRVTTPLTDEDLGKWVHLAGGYDGTSWRLFKNGVEVDEAAAPSGYSGGARTWTIGATLDPQSGLGALLDGAVYDVRIYSRAVGQGKALALYLNGLLRIATHCDYDTSAGAATIGQNGRLIRAMSRNLPLDNALERGLRGAWKLDEGENHDRVASSVVNVPIFGDLRLSPQWVKDTPSGLGWSLYFDNTTTGAPVSNYQRVALPVLQSLDIVGPITMAAWVKFDLTNGERGIVVHGGLEPPQTVVYLALSNGDLVAGRAHATGSFAQASYPAAALIGAWHLVVGTFDGNRWRLYVDGRQVAAQPDNEGALSISTPWVIGAGLKGAVSGARLYDRALSDDEVERMFILGRPSALTVGVVTERFIYDADSNIVQHFITAYDYDAEERVTTFHRDALGNVVRTDYPQLATQGTPGSQPMHAPQPIVEEVSK